MSHALGNNYGKFYSFLNKPVLIDCNFVVDSTNGNGLGIRNLKGAGVKSVVMNSTVGAPVGTPVLGTARTYGILAATAITNTGSSVITGNVGLTPGTSVTGFPPGTISGAENIDNPAVIAAKASAQAAYTDLHSRASTTIASALDGQTLTPGVYSFASGAATLAASGNGTLTLNGNGVYVIQTTTTLGTGAGGIPTITLSGGALASNVYWVIGSSATLNISGSGAFIGNMIANTSVTVDGGSTSGSLVALNGAVTLSAATTITTQALAVNNSPAPGYAWIELAYNYSRYCGGFSGFVSPLTGSPIAINSTNLVVGNPYVIVSVGHAAAGAITISPVADVAGSLASKYFTFYDAYGNTFVIWFSVGGIGSAPINVGGTLVQQTIAPNSSAATIGAALVVTINGLLAAQLGNQTAPAGVFSFTAAGTTTVTATNTSTSPYKLPGGPQDGFAPLATGFAFAWSVNDSNLADWQGVGVPPGVVPAVGVSFIAKASGSGSSTGLVEVPGISGVASIEVIGDPNASLAPIPMGGSPNVGGWILVQFLAPLPTAPIDGSVVGMSFYVEAASMIIKGE